VQRIRVKEVLFLKKRKKENGVSAGWIQTFINWAVSTITVACSVLIFQLK
jgi:hypothetical protein